MGKFRISKQFVERMMFAVERENYPDVKSMAKLRNLSSSYVGDLYDEIRRGLKRGDLNCSNKTMEFFLRTSQKEAKLLDSLCG